MTREPKIPMSPSELPQQRIHEVVGLPERPEPNADLNDTAHSRPKLQ